MRILTFFLVFVFSFVNVHTACGISSARLHAEEFDDLELDDLGGLEEEDPLSDDLDDDLEGDLGDELGSFDEPLEEEEEKEESTEDDGLGDDFMADDPTAGDDDLGGFGPEEETPVDQFGDFSDDEPADDSFAPASETDSVSGRRVAAVYLFSDSYAKEKAKKAVRFIVKTMQAASGVVYLDTESQMFMPPGSLEKRDLDRGMRLFENAKQEYNNLMVEDAIRHFEQAQRIMEKQVDNLIDMKPLSRVLLYLGTSHKMFGEDEKAKAFIVRYLNMNPDAVLDETVFSPEITDFFNSVKQDFMMLPNGSVSFKTYPSGGLVFVDGRIMGMTPITIPGLTAGKHYFRVHKLGYKDIGGDFKIYDKETTSFNKDLVLLGDASFLKGLEDNLRRDYGSFFMLKKALEAAEKIGVDEFVVYKLDVSEGDILVDVIVVRARDRDFKRTSIRVPLPADPGGDMGSLRADLESYLGDTYGYKSISSLADQSLDAELGVKKETDEKTDDDDESIVKKWWFWTLIGVPVAAGAGVGTYFLVRPDTNKGATMEVDFQK